MLHLYSKTSFMQKLQLSIPQPCHENWQHMTATEQGRFCNACAKEVIDFSMMTDTEVLNYFTSLTHEKVCGRALPTQLNRNITLPKEPKKRLFWYWNYIVMFFMFFGKANSVKAQGQVYKTTQTVPVKTNDITVEISTTPKVKKGKSRVVTGKVSDRNGNPVSFAAIKIKGTKLGLSADANGVYSIKVNAATVLEISALSFNTIEVPVGNQNVLSTILIKELSSKLKETVVTMAICTKRAVKKSDVVKPEDLSDKVAGAKLRSTEIGKLGTETVIRLGNVVATSKDNPPIYVVDGTIMANSSNITPDDVDDLTVLQAPAATTIYGAEGANGAIVITTRKAKEMSLDTVITSAAYATKMTTSSAMMGAVSIIDMQIEKQHEIITPAVEHNDAFTVYPNPVQRGNTINLNLNSKQTGLHQIQITDANGRTVFYKRINAVGKNQLEQIICDNKWGTGLYFIILFDGKNKLVNKSSFIVQ